MLTAMRKPHPLLFTWPQVSVLQITSSINTANFGPKNLTKLVQAQADKAQRTHFLQQMENSVEIQAVTLLQQEQSWYQPEIDFGKILRDEIRQTQQLSPERRTLLRSRLNGLNSNSLKGILKPLLHEGKLRQMEIEIADYYGLTADPVQSSYDFLLRHPHKPTLHLRRLLRNPLIDPALQEELCRFLEMSRISEKDKPHLLELLKQAESQYQERLLTAQQTGDAIQQIREKFYRQTTQDLQHFVDEHNRLPKENSQDAVERQLHNDASYLRYHRDELSSTPQIQQEYQDLKAVWTNGEIKVDLIFYQATQQSLHQFIDTHKRRPKWNTLDPEEFQLYQDILLVRARRDYAAIHPELQEVFMDIENMWNSHVPQVWPYEEMLRRYEQHGIETGKWGLPEDLRQNPNLTPEEIEFYDNVSYYVFSYSKTLPDLQAIDKKHTSGQ